LGAAAEVSCLPENTDRDPLEFITVHFPLISKAKLPAIRTALDDLFRLAAILAADSAPRPYGRKAASTGA
jgi:hypothetical protein